MTTEAQLQWTGKLQFVGRVGNGPAVVMDTPEGGGGPSPMEILLMGVAGCTAVDVMSIMQKKRSPLIDFQVRITGDRADNHPRRYTRIHVEYIFKGNGIKTKDVEQAIRLSEMKYCGAMASMNADFTHSYRMEEIEK